MANKRKPADKGGFYVYIGPGIRGVIQHGAIYKSRSDPVLTAAVAAYPAVGILTVPGERLAADRVRIRTPGNALYEAYRRLSG